ncbi:hypothetical protein IGI04_042376 [Brassica rapa subsp. trilocularis]|uniref:Uncharacterized protein n=1 Tax=Brassica rapa subsp. trilocularis TaxID=1813537 RepID=A0ABQ7KIG7_BRACM|nr:hypothetical protein IGI04_042376 [Brassica rapa subsp. trilocularis]
MNPLEKDPCPCPISTWWSGMRWPLWMRFLDVDRFIPREIARQRREVEQQAHLQRLGFDMENLPQDGEAQGGNEGQEELCFINANGTWYKKEPNFPYQNNFQQRPLYNNQQGGYQANQSPQIQGSSSQAQAPDSSVDSMFKQLLEFQARNEKTMIYEFKNIHAKIDGNYSDLNNKYMQLASHLKALESQVASMPSSSKQPMGSLPGKPENNPKESCNVVFSTTSPKIELSNHEKEEDEIERLVYGTQFGEVERFIVATAEAQIVKNAATKVEATNLQRAEHKAEKQVEKRADNKLKQVKLEEATKVELSPYDQLPFPQRVLTKAQKKVLSKFRKDLSDVGVRLPEISGMREAHVQMMLMNDILDHQAEVAELLNISILKIDPPIPPKSLPKLESQGMFTLPCYLGKLFLDDALVDSGATSSIEKTKAEGVGIEKEDLAGESSKELCDEHLESAKKKEVSRATKVAHDKKKIVKESHPPPLDKTLHTLTLHPMKLKDGVIEYKIKCKGRSAPI